MIHETRDVILIVDDIEINRMILAEILKDDYDIVEAGSGTEALSILFEDELSPTVVLLDIMMPDIDGFQVLEKMKNSDSTKHIPVLFITAANSDETESLGLKSGAADYVAKPFNHDVVRARVDNHIKLARYRNKLEQLVAKKAAEVTRTYEQTLEILATIIEYRNLESGAHIRRTTLLTEIMVMKMLEMDKFRPLLLDENIISLIKASALHDIGKIGISDRILLKPGKLTPEEFDIIKTHTTISSQIIDSISATLPDEDMYLKYAKEIGHFHHERWDGGGYPNGLKGDNIPLSARIISIVDVYDALVNPRCYKAAYPYDVSLDIIRQGKGTQFDPDIVDLLPEVGALFKDIEESYQDH
ncbi:MAG: response regulator [Oscillospiraceae bacterium]|nr:response regulator [Oscillospiraceae bacterium]